MLGFKNFIAFIALILVSAACGDKADNPTTTERTFSAKPYLIVDQGSLNLGESEISGSGSIVFKNPVGEIGSDKNYNLTFSIEDGGTLQLVSHADNKLARGVTIKMSRSGAKLSVSFLADGKETPSKVLKNVNASADIQLSIDVHNKETPAHILLWTAGQVDPDDDNALINSAVHYEEDTPGLGAGKSRFCGLILNKALVKNMTVEDAKFGH